MMWALALVILLIFIMAFAYKRKKAKTSDLISVIAYQSLGQKIGIAAVKIKQEVLIIGITQNDFKLLKRFDETALKTATPSRQTEEVSGIRKIKEGFLNA